MAPFRASRSTRSGRPGGPSDHDIFDGLPVRQWRLRDSALAATTEANSHAANKQDYPPGHHPPEPPMPKGSESYKPYCIQLLKAARAGKFLKAQQPATNGFTNPTENDNRPQEKAATADAVRSLKRSHQPSLVITRWAQVPKNLEEAELEYLAKRRKGLDRSHPGKTVTWATLGDTSHMRKTKVLKEHEGGQTQILEVMVPEGKTVQGEIKEEIAVNAASAAVSAPAPGTVIEGLGVANEEGVVVATEGVIPLKKPGPIRRKKKPLGRRKMTETAGTGVSASVEALEQQLGQSNSFDPSSSAKLEGQADSNMTGTKDTEEDEGEEDDDDDNDEEDEDGSGEEDEDNEDGGTHEAQPPSQTADMQPEPPSINESTLLETSIPDEVKLESEQPTPTPTTVPMAPDPPGELSEEPPMSQANEGTVDTTVPPLHDIEMGKDPMDIEQPIDNGSNDFPTDSTTQPPANDSLPPLTFDQAPSAATTEADREQQAAVDAPQPPNIQPTTEIEDRESAAPSEDREAKPVMESIEPQAEDPAPPQTEAPPPQLPQHIADVMNEEPAQREDESSSSQSPLRPSPEPLSPPTESPLSQPPSDIQLDGRAVSQHLQEIPAEIGNNGGPHASESNSTRPVSTDGQ